MTKTILHYRSHYLGLTETFIYYYLKHLKAFKPVVLTNKVENLHLFPFEDIIDRPRRRPYTWNWFEEGCYRRFLKRDIFFERVIKKNNVQLIHAHFGPDGVEVMEKNSRLPLITTFYGYDVSMLPQKDGWRERYQRLFEAGRLFLVEGNHMKKQLQALGCPVKKIRVQHIAVDVRGIPFKERRLEVGENVRILFCGRFVEKKGLEYALMAIKILVKSHPNIEFRVIGDGALRQPLEDLIAKENLGTYVQLLGYQPLNVLREEIQEAHILLQPSVTAKDGDSEGGAPTVLLEAQASGLPVVSTIHADIPEVVVDGKSGFLVPERNPEALAEKLAYLIEHPERWAEMGRAGRGHIEEHYNIEKEVRKLEDVYREVLAS